MLSCKQQYTPPAIRANPGYLVVDGVLNVGQDSTIITLSRTRNLDSISPVPELQAQVMVLGAFSENYPLKEQGNGRYVADHLNLNYNEVYQLKIITAENKEYLSDTFSAKQTPPIDSLSWKQDTLGVNINLYAHDPTNSTLNYRWDYVETWEYHTAFYSYFDYINGQVVYRDTSDRIYTCWSNFHSSDILLGSTSKLSEDVVNKKLIATVPRGSEKISIRYSILVNQYAITEDALAYWQNLKKNTEQLGTLFDPQPSQLKGNIHAVTNPDEPVLGFISASTIQHKRIFISSDDVTLWGYQRYYYECFVDNNATIKFGQDRADDYLGKPNHLYTLLMYAAGVYTAVEDYCADCREHGGVNQRPNFW